MFGVEELKNAYLEWARLWVQFLALEKKKCGCFDGVVFLIVANVFFLMTVEDDDA